jgi:AraC-like DNA-binding protein
MHLSRHPIDDRSNPRKARHVHNGHEMLVIDGGPGVQLTAAGEEDCEDNDVFVFAAGVSHLSYCRTGQSFACLVLQSEPGDFADGASGDGGATLLARIAETTRAHNRLRLRPATKTVVRSCMEQALAEWRSAAPGARCAGRAAVMAALVAVVRDPHFAEGGSATDDDAGDSGDRHVDEVVRWLEQYWMRPVAIAELVALGRLGRSQLLARFRARTGTTIGEALLATRVRAAQDMLREGDGTMLDIALTCGFGSQSHFNHRFKAVTGLSPKAWSAKYASP